MPADGLAGAAVSVPVAVAFVGLVIGNISSILGAYVSLKVAIAKLEVKVDANSKDIDGLGKILETDRSKGA